MTAGHGSVGARHAVPLRILVVGAGPAGMMAAIRAAELGARVTLVDKNKMAGRKLLLSGKGRCNLTNACSLDESLARFSRSGIFLRDAFKKFFNRELIAFFEKRGLAMKVERQGRVFPQSDSSASIVEVLRKELLAKKVALLSGKEVAQIRLAKGAVSGVTLTTGEFLSADRLILAVGGVTYRFTGSTGRSWEMVGRTGHTLHPPRPGLVALRTAEPFVKKLEGLTLKNVRVWFVRGKKKTDAGLGELLFTRRGVSGPLILTASGQVLDWLSKGQQVSVRIDLKPALGEEKLDERIRRDFLAMGRTVLKNSLRELMPQRLIPVVLERTGIDGERLVNQVTRDERLTLARLLKDFTLTVTGSEPLDEAMITRGGVSLKEIDPRTMASRLIRGLYFAGEMIDVDADTGGFNLQAAFSTGYLAGESAAQTGFANRV